MNIPWKLKSKVFSFIDSFNAQPLLYYLQKNVTKRSRIKKLEVNQEWVAHRIALIENQCTSRVFEFGAGKSLAQNLYLSNIVDRQIVVDLNPMIDIGLVEQARSLLANKVKLRSQNRIKSLSDLNNYGIDYRAPYDASKTDLANKSLDACVSTNTLEHIPREQILDIFLELFRTLKDTGIVSAKIDYSDHYAHTDSKISLLNYLNFSEEDWKKHNHRCHFQNRLRHTDYKKIFLDCGFEIISEKLSFDQGRISDELKRKYIHDDPTWCSTSAHFVLRKRLLN